MIEPKFERNHDKIAISVVVFEQDGVSVCVYACVRSNIMVNIVDPESALT